MIWMNIDIPLKTCTIHSDPNCPYIKNMAETRYKGIDHLKRDGGWLPFEHIREAKEFHLAKFDQYHWKEHCYFSSDIAPAANGRPEKRMPAESDGLSFNDVTDHYQKVVGLPGKRIHLMQLPRWLRVFYRLVIAIVIVGVTMILVAKLVR
jgi:hypothetical protein